MFEIKIVVLDGYTENPGDLSWEEFERLGDLTVYDRTPAELVTDRIGDAEAVITNKTVLSDSIFAECPGIKYIGVLATGYNIVDTIAAKKRGITVTNIPTYGTAAVAQFTFALLLEICHHVGAHSEGVKAGKWTKSPDFCYWDYPLIELAGKTLGIIGYGRIGSAVAATAKSFGMKILTYSSRISRDEENDAVEFTTREELFAQSDIISLHCPLTPATQGMINRENMLKMKDEVILINTSRGGLINEEDLKAMLISGKVAYAAVDVVSAEPIKADNPLLSAPNCIITPHIAWAPKESRARLMHTAADNLKAYIDGSPRNQVNG